MFFLLKILVSILSLANQIGSESTVISWVAIQVTIVKLESQSVVGNVPTYFTLFPELFFFLFKY